ncbi:H-NS family nucleoid-associated regulatory protein [Enterobacter vonholyi]
MIFEKIENKEQVLSSFEKMGFENAEIIFAFIKEAYEEFEYKHQVIIEEEKKRKEAKEKIEELLKEQGLTMEELYTSVAVEEKKKRTAKPKYKIEVNGVEHTWSGRGRKPKVFEEVGENLEKYLIKE